MTYGSPLDYELSLLFGSVCRSGPKQWKKKGPRKNNDNDNDDDDDDDDDN